MMEKLRKTGAVWRAAFWALGQGLLRGLSVANAHPRSILGPGTESSLQHHRRTVTSPLTHTSPSQLPNLTLCARILSYLATRPLPNSSLNTGLFFLLLDLRFSCPKDWSLWPELLRGRAALEGQAPKDSYPLGLWSQSAQVLRPKP